MPVPPTRRDRKRQKTRVPRQRRVSTLSSDVSFPVSCPARLGSRFKYGQADASAPWCGLAIKRVALHIFPRVEEPLRGLPWKMNNWNG